MTEQAWGTATTTRQPGRRQAHRCTRHSSPSADLIIRVLQKTEESPLIATVLKVHFSSLHGRFIKTITNARKFFKYLTPRGLIGWGERGWFGSSNSSNPGQSIWEGTVVFTARSRHPVVIVCTWVCGYAFGQTWRQAFARSNEIWLLYYKLTTVFCCLALPCKVKVKLQIWLATLKKCPLTVTYIKGKLKVCVCGVWGIHLKKFFLIKSRCYLLKLFMNQIYSALILTTVTPSPAESHTLRLRVYCVPAACAPALAATFPDAFAPHPGPKTSGHPAWPGATPGMTPARPHHTSTHTQILMDTFTIKKNDHHSHIQSHQGSGNPHHYQHGPRRTYAKTSTPHSPQKKRKRREKQK